MSRGLQLPLTLLSLLVSHNVHAAPSPFKVTFPSFYNDNPPKDASNKAVFPAQICGIVGGYVLAVLIWGVLLLTIGRKMRRKTENSPRTLELELVTKNRPAVKSPIASPGSARSTARSLKSIFKKEKPSDSAIGSPTSPQVHSPGSFDQKVLDADKARAQEEMERLYAAVRDHDRKKSYSQVSTEEQEIGLTERRPSAINTSRDGTHSNPSSPVKAIYPPGYHKNGPPTAPLPVDRLRDQPPASPRSILSKKSHTSNASSSSKTRFNLKHLRISGPVQKYPHDRDEEARTPLSPRFYNPGAPPSPPTQQNSPTTPGDLEEAYEQLDEVQPLPHPAPQRTGSMASSQGTPTTSQPQPRSAASSNSNLPLRGYAEPLKSPDLRTTVLDRRMDKLSMTTPKTGVPYTPYSPYMPFTPVTPVTPHLVTKKERKMMKKYEGRKMQAHQDMVQSPKEIFGDAW